MQRKKLKALFILAFIISLNSLTAQIRNVLIQQFTVTYNGTTDTADYMPLVIDTSGNVTVATNKKISATQYDASTAGLLSSGITNWIDSYNSTAGGKAFVTAACKDNANNVYVTGAVRTSSTGLDMFVLGYTSTGTRFMGAMYDGPNHTTDAGIAICVDNAGQVYITGASDGTLAGVADYATVAFDAATGSQVWASRYNYTGAIDIPTAITYDPSGIIYVTGASGTTFTDYDVATVQYRSSNGAYINSDRTINSGAGFDKPFGMATDALGNVYIAGTMFNGLTNNYDIQVQKLDTSLTQIWVKNYDGYGYDDAGVGIALDGLGNVIVTGALSKSNGDQRLVVLKYDNNGHPIHSYFGSSLISSEGLRVKTDANDDVFIGGQYGNGAAKDAMVLVLDSALKQVGEKVFNSTYGLEDKFMDMVVSADKIYLSVRSFNGSDDDNVVVTYSYKNFDEHSIMDTITNVPQMADELIMSFHKGALKMSAINDRNFIYGKLSDFVADSTCAKLTLALQAYTHDKSSAKDLDCRKIHTNLTEADSLSETRLGTYAKVPMFYADLLVSLPSGVSAPALSALFRTVAPDITSCQLNYVYTPWS